MSAIPYKDFEAFIRRIHALPDDGEGPSAHDHPTAVFSLGDRSLTLTDADAIEYWRLIDEFQARAPAQHGPGAIAQQIQQAIFAALGGKNFAADLASAMSTFKKYLSQPAAEWVVVVPVRGLEPESLPQRVGPAKFSRLTTARVTALATRFRRKDRRRFQEQFLDPLEGETIAEIRVSAVDREAAQIAGNRRIQGVIDVVNFYADFLAYGRPLLYVPGERTRELTREIVHQRSRGGAMTVSLVRRGPSSPLPLRDVIARARHHHFAHVARLLMAPAPTEIERRLLRAIQWCGRAAASTRFDTSLLSAVIGLEAAVLGPKRSGEIGYRLKLRCAKLLAKRPVARTKVSRTIDELYSLRSRVAHTGSSEVSERDARLAKTVARSAVLALVGNRHLEKMSSDDEMEQWFNNLVLN